MRRDLPFGDPVISHPSNFFIVSSFCSSASQLTPLFLLDPTPHILCSVNNAQSTMLGQHFLRRMQDSRMSIGKQGLQYSARKRRGFAHQSSELAPLALPVFASDFEGIYLRLKVEEEIKLSFSIGQFIQAIQSPNTQTFAH